MHRVSSAHAPGSGEPAAPDEAAPERQLEEQIRELRRIKRLTLSQLAQSAGVSVGYLSQLERKRSRLPIGTLRRICDVRGVHISWFFPSAAAGPAAEGHGVVRAQQRRRMSFTRLGINEELLLPNLAGPLELLLSTLETGPTAVTTATTVARPA